MKKLNFLISEEQNPDNEWKGDLGDGVINGGRQCPVNLMNGLRKIGVDFDCTFLRKDKIKNNTTNISLNSDSLRELTKYGKNVLDNSIIGPLGVGIPDDEESLWLFKNIKHCMVHTEWIKKLYIKTLNNSILQKTKTNFDPWKNYDLIENFKYIYPINFYKWPVGIDSDFFKPEKKKKEIDCFLYTKWRGDSIDECISVLDKLNLKYETVSHGQYTQQELKNLCNKSKFCIHITGDETQNMAGMEILSCDTPVLVFDFNFNHYVDYCSSFEYFDEGCGLKLNQYDYYPKDHRGRGVENSFDIIENNIIHMLKTHKEYSPREYILNNHTLKKSAESFMNIINKIN